MFKFTGGVWDAAIDLMYQRARYYDPATGTWTSPDPLGFGGGQKNLYEYAGDDPVNATDPTGKFLFAASRDAKSLLIKEYANAGITIKGVEINGARSIGEGTRNNIWILSYADGPKTPPESATKIVKETNFALHSLKTRLEDIGNLSLPEYYRSHPFNISTAFEVIVNEYQGKLTPKEFSPSVIGSQDQYSFFLALAESFGKEVTRRAYFYANEDLDKLKKIWEQDREQAVKFYIEHLPETPKREYVPEAIAYLKTLVEPLLEKQRMGQRLTGPELEQLKKWNSLQADLARDGYSASGYKKIPPGEAARISAAMIGTALSPKPFDNTLSLGDKLIKAAGKSIQYLPKEGREQLAKLVSPEAVALYVGAFAVVLAAQGTPAAVPVDIGLGLIALAWLGSDAVDVVTSLNKYATLAEKATTEADFDEAGKHLAHAVTVAVADALLLVGGELVSGKVLRKVKVEKPTGKPAKIVIEEPAQSPRKPKDVLINGGCFVGSTMVIIAEEQSEEVSVFPPIVESLDIEETLLLLVGSFATLLGVWQWRRSKNRRQKIDLTRRQRNRGEASGVGDLEWA